jgi:hypothetical protein
MIVLPAGVTREQLLACVDREIQLRNRVYPRRLEAGRMTLAQSLRELELMKAVREVLTQLPATQNELFPK